MYEERKLKCPAFDKQCKKCNKTGHFQVRCLSKYNKQTKAEAKEVTAPEASSVDSVSMGEMAGLMMVLASVSRAMNKQNLARQAAKVPYMVSRI